MLGFIAALPKVELHVHLVGSASPDTVLTLARRHPHRGVPTDEAELRQFYEFTGFGHFIDVYAKVNALVTTGDDVAALVLGLAEEQARRNVRYAEVTVSATSHLRAGIAPEELDEALAGSRAEALAEHDVELAWVFDVPGLWDRDFGLTTARYAIDHRPAGTVGFGLGGFEADAPRRAFREAFALARDAGLHCVPHAGETTGPDQIWQAVDDLNAVRVGHGTSAVRDPELLAHLRDHRITLEVCPTSNLRTAAVARIEDHPLPRLLEAGVPVTLATDDPGMFHTDLNREYLLCHEEFGLGRSELADLARAGVRASFASDQRKAELLAGITATEQAS
ncbi:aminodeoxyfutalosine deaminase [Saccharothrix tamanrassetensis]|uniref:Aminodeoxyfutalosine deaminase n=1 Tax=Saccharothrix tamanrassetensis TaxID=1051531 RepID=A0A841CVE2_9PSEU|nr:adenosine deaminase [Saccharothrix tamanrassetensis]MBB5959987.1 aminodeoxyfutalosine deaminase [Saccharothrix tamanrassetensis]